LLLVLTHSLSNFPGVTVTSREAVSRAEGRFFFCMPVCSIVTKTLGDVIFRNSCIKCIIAVPPSNLLFFIYHSSHAFIRL
jgi:hypothetical protein